MQLSQKQTTFSQFLSAFLKSILKFNPLPKKDNPHSWCISGNTSSEKYGEINVWKAVLQRTLRQTAKQICQNTVPIWMAAPLQYSLITVKVVVMEKVSFSDIKIPKAIC